MAESLPRTDTHAQLVESLPRTYTLARWKQNIQEFKAIIHYIVVSKPTWDIKDSDSKMKKEIVCRAE